MIVSTVIALELGTYAVGSTPLGPAVLPDWVTRVQVAARRCTTVDPLVWPDANSRVEIPCRVSLDGGQSQAELGGFGANGGILTSPKTGTEYEWSIAEVEVPAGTGRLFSADLIVSGADAYTEVQLTLIGDEA